MFGSRRGRPSLIGRAAQTAARTAVITATASTVANKMHAGRAAPAAPVAEPLPPVAVAAVPVGGGLGDEAIARLRELGELKVAGILTEEEFAVQKARILA